MKQFLNSAWGFIKILCVILVLTTLGTAIYTAKYTADGKCKVNILFNIKE